MVLLNSHNIDSYEISFELPEFCLKNIDEKFISKNDINFEHGVLVAFICNHCPYVKAIIKDLVHDSKILLEKYKIGTICINPNDSMNPKYSEDSFEKMKEFAKSHEFHFPYLVDETQEVAKKFDAVCTPDLFLFIKDQKSGKYFLNYKGRLNNFVYKFEGPQTSENFKEKKPELLEYVEMFFQNQSNSSCEIPHTPIQSMGCSIKWRD